VMQDDVPYLPPMVVVRNDSIVQDTLEHYMFIMSTLFGSFI
jgi:hypothetical protein